MTSYMNEWMVYLNKQKRRNYTSPGNPMAHRLFFVIPLFFLLRLTLELFRMVSLDFRIVVTYSCNFLPPCSFSFVQRWNPIGVTGVTVALSVPARLPFFLNFHYFKRFLLIYLSLTTMRTPVSNGTEFQGNAVDCLRLKSKRQAFKESRPNVNATL